MRKEGERATLRVALAGNPNVGKSTLFNSLTGMNVHTGNWAGKTVANASGEIIYSGRKISLIDIPGTYSLIPHSEEERVASEFLINGELDLIVVVLDASSLAQNLNLFLQISLLRKPTILVINLIDEAKRRGITVDCKRLSELLSLDAIPTVAHKRKTLIPLLEKIIEGGRVPKCPLTLTGELYNAYRLIEEKYGEGEAGCRLLSLLSRGEPEYSSFWEYTAPEPDRDTLLDSLATAQRHSAKRIAGEVISSQRDRGIERTKRVDKILTGRVTAFPVMLLFLALIFLLTLVFASYPSELLARLFTTLEGHLVSFFAWLDAPSWLSSPLIFGIYRTLSQVVAVMLPPMLIFFPFFSLLEDSGYLPRVAYNLDKPFAAVGSSGKQSLCMCMGLGCNAVGVVGCRIMNNRCERESAIITNSLMPCNGRLPMLISLLGVFWLLALGRASNALVALGLLVLILLSVGLTFLSTLVLTKTLYHNKGGTFIIELPPYRRPRVLSTVYHALKDKCLSILLRAVIVSIPVGLIVYLFANIYIGDMSVLLWLSGAFDPIGRFFGMDGAILLAFVLAIPANEIVIPTLIMIYSSSVALPSEVGLEYMRELFLMNGWTAITAICTGVFALLHFPCSTTLITIYKETKSKRATLISFLLPTVLGLTLAMLISLISKIFI